jgi:uncharacterized protein YybS (DUF2232 family)
VSREILVALGGGLASAVFYLSVVTGTPGAILLAYLSPLPLFLAGLSAHWKGAAIACAVAAVAVAAGTSFAAAGMFIALVVVPTMIVVRQGLLSRPGTGPGTLEWYPPGMLMGWLTGYGLAALCLAALYLASAGAGLEVAASRFLNETLGRIADAPHDPRVQMMLDALARFLPGMMVGVWLVVTAANAALAQGLLARFGWNLRPSPSFGAMELPRWMTVALVVAILLSLISGQIGTFGQNALIVAAVPFLFLGLAVIHTLLQRVAARGFILAVLYLLLILFGWPAIFVVGVGIIEQWVELRRRYGGPPDDQEEV